MPRGVPKARVEGSEALRTVKTSDYFATIVERFKADHPDAWEEMRLWPLQSGVEAMAEKLKG